MGAIGFILGHDIVCGTSLMLVMCCKILTCRDLWDKYSHTLSCSFGLIYAGYDAPNLRYADMAYHM